MGGTVDVTYYFTDFNLNPQSVTRVTQTPLPHFADYNGAILTPSPIALITSGAGAVTFTNTIAGYTYRIQIDTPFGSTVRTCGIPVNVSGPVNGLNYIGNIGGLTNGAVTTFYYLYLSPTGGGATNAVATVSSNGVAIGNFVTNLSFWPGTNTTVNFTNRNGLVDVLVSSTGGSGVTNNQQLPGNSVATNLSANLLNSTNYQGSNVVGAVAQSIHSTNSDSSTGSLYATNNPAGIPIQGNVSNAVSLYVADVPVVGQRDQQTPLNYVWMATTGDLNSDAIITDPFASPSSAACSVGLWYSSDGLAWSQALGQNVHNVQSPLAYTNFYNGPIAAKWSLLYTNGQWWACQPLDPQSAGGLSQGVMLWRSYDLTNWSSEKVLYPMGTTNSMGRMLDTSWFVDVDSSVWIIMAYRTNQTTGASTDSVLSMNAADVSLTNWNAVNVIKQGDVTREGVIMKGPNNYYLYYRCPWPNLEWLLATNTAGPGSAFFNYKTNFGWGAFGAGGNAGQLTILKIAPTHWRAYMRDESVASSGLSMNYLESNDAGVTWGTWNPLTGIVGSYSTGIAIVPDHATNQLISLGATNIGGVVVQTPLLRAQTVKGKDATFDEGLQAGSLFSKSDVTTMYGVRADSLFIRTGTTSPYGNVVNILAVGGIFMSDGGGFWITNSSIVASGNYPSLPLTYDLGKQGDTWRALYSSNVYANAVFSTNLTPKTVVSASAGDQLVSIPNAIGYLNNDGSGNFSWSSSTGGGGVATNAIATVGSNDVVIVNPSTNLVFWVWQNLIFGLTNRNTGTADVGIRVNPSLTNISSIGLSNSATITAATGGNSNAVEIVNKVGQTVARFGTNGTAVLGTNNQLVLDTSGNLTIAGQFNGSLAGAAVGSLPIVAIASMGAFTTLANANSGAANPAAVSTAMLMDAAGNTVGGALVRDGGNWTNSKASSVTVQQSSLNVTNVLNALQINATNGLQIFGTAPTYISTTANGLSNVISFPTGSNGIMFAVGSSANPSNILSLTNTLGALRMDGYAPLELQWGNAFSGLGSGLTNLNASSLSSGTVPLAQMPTLLSAYPQAITNGDNRAGGVTLSNGLQVIGNGLFTNGNVVINGTGLFAGNGGGLTNLNAGVLTGYVYTVNYDSSALWPADSATAVTPPIWNTNASAGYTFSTNIQSSLTESLMSYAVLMSATNRWKIIDEIPQYYGGGAITCAVTVVSGTNYGTAPNSKVTNVWNFAGCTLDAALGTAVPTTNNLPITTSYCETNWTSRTGVTLGGTPLPKKKFMLRIESWAGSPYFTATNNEWLLGVSITWPLTNNQLNSITVP